MYNFRIFRSIRSSPDFFLSQWTSNWNLLTSVIVSRKNLTFTFIFNQRSRSASYVNSKIKKEEKGFFSVAEKAESLGKER